MKDAELRRQEVITNQAKKAGFRGRINAKCVECIYDPYCSGSWRSQVSECTDLGCPLHQVRPMPRVNRQESDFEENNGLSQSSA